MALERGNKEKKNNNMSIRSQMKRGYNKEKGVICKVLKRVPVVKRRDVVGSKGGRCGGKWEIGEGGRRGRLEG